MANIFNDGKVSSALLNVLIWGCSMLSLIFIMGVCFYIIKNFSYQLKASRNRTIHFFQRIGCLFNKNRIIDIEKSIKYNELTDSEKKKLNSFEYKDVILTYDEVKCITLLDHELTDGRVMMEDFNVIPQKKLVVDADSKCSICLADFLSTVSENTFSNAGFRQDRKRVIILPCKHVFHCHCMRNWIVMKKREANEKFFDEYFGFSFERYKIQCPLCRLDLNRCKLVCNQIGLPIKKVCVQNN